MPFQTGTATDYVDLLNKLVTYVTSQSVASASVAAGGTGYTVGDILTASGGTFSQAATFEVTSVSGGVVTSVKIRQNGAYTSNPSNPVSTTGGTGTGATLTLTFASTGWVLERESKQVLSATVSAGGTGYVVGDVLTLSGGTVVQAGQFVVTTVSSGAVTAVARFRRGNYEITPTNPAATTGGTGTGATLTVTYQGVFLDTDQEAASATVSAGGTGYTLNDILTVSGGTFTTAAQFRVTGVSAGVVTSVTAYTPGEYSATPTNPAATTGGTGTGATLTVTYQSIQPNPDKQAILRGTGAGSDSIYAGIRTFNDALGSGARNWELAGFTGYNAASPFTTQPGISPGRFDGSGSAQEGAYVPLTNSTITYWLMANGRRIVLVARMGSTYTNMYLGWLNPFATASQYPYPLLVCGCSSLWNRLFSAAVVEMSGMVDPITHTTTANGPGFIRDPGGSWKGVRNSGGAASARVPRQELVVLPCGSPLLTGLPTQDIITTSPAWDYYDMVPGTGSPGTAALRVHQIPDTPNDKSILIPTALVEVSPVQQVLGEMSDVYWVSGIGTVANLVSEDSIVVGADTYRVFQNCNRTDLHAMFAVKEA